jgi:hypothetical protein
VLRASPTLAGRLASAEAELAQLEAAAAAPVAPKAADVSVLLAALPSLARRAVDQLEETLASGDVSRARTEIKDKVGAGSRSRPMSARYGSTASRERLPQRCCGQLEPTRVCVVAGAGL